EDHALRAQRLHRRVVGPPALRLADQLAVPVDPERGQVLDLALFRDLAHPVEVLDPQGEGAPAAASQHPRADRGAHGAQVQGAAGVREGGLPAAVTAMISGPLPAARPPSCGCASTARMASLATPRPVASGARRQYALSTVPSSRASGVRPTTPSSPVGSGAGA